MRADVVTRSDRKRFNEQAVAVLARLQAGPATALELAAVALNYRARISELRAGWVIDCERGEPNRYVLRGRIVIVQLGLFGAA